MGRKSLIDELKSNKICHLAQDTIFRALNASDEVIPLVDKLRVALPVVLKTMPDKIELDDINALSREEKLQIMESIRLLIRQPIMDLPHDTNAIT